MYTHNQNLNMVLLEVCWDWWSKHHLSCISLNLYFPSFLWTMLSSLSLHVPFLGVLAFDSGISSPWVSLASLGKVPFSPHTGRGLVCLCWPALLQKSGGELIIEVPSTLPDDVFSSSWGWELFGVYGGSGSMTIRGPIPISSGNLEARSKLQLL